MGGLSRRATVLKEVKQPILSLEASNWAWKSSHVPKGTLDQLRRKAELQIKALTMQNIDVMAVGTGEMALGLDWLSEQTAPFLLSNIHCGEKEPWLPLQIFSRGGLQIGVLSVMDKQSKLPSECTFEDPHTVFKTIASSHNVDVWIVSSELSEQENRALSTELSRSIFVDSKTRRMLENPNLLTSNSVLLAGGSRGKHVGVASITIEKDAQAVHVVGIADSIAKQREKYQQRIDKAQKEMGSKPKPDKAIRLEKQIALYTKKRDELPEIASKEGNVWSVQNKLYALNTSVKDDLQTDVLIQEYKVAEEKIGADEKDSYFGPFVGSKACQGCHPYQYLQWEGTAHAKAWNTLVEEKRSQDKACFSCHVTGAHQEGGPQTPSEAHGLENVGCESCHGSGKEHIASSGQTDMIKEPTLNNCVQCHDGEQDEGRFDAVVYYPKIRHPALRSGGEE